MPDQTPRGFPFVVPADHPLEYPAASQQLAQAIEDRGLLASSVYKASDQSGIASGGSAGITATLNGLRVGAPVLGLFSLQGIIATVPTIGFLAHAALTGGTVVGSPSVKMHAATATYIYQWNSIMLFTATATSLSVGMMLTTSNASAWTCSAGSTITLVSL